MPPSLIIAGLGPGDPRLRTIETVDALRNANRIILRTGIHPGVDALLADPRVSTCDDLYQAGGTFDEVYSAISQRVLDAAACDDIVFAVPGHPLVGETSVTTILERAEAFGIDVAILDGISAFDAISTALTIDLLASQARIVDATELALWIEREPFAGGIPDFSPRSPLLVTQVYSIPVATATKLALGRLVPETHEIVVVRAAGVPESQSIRSIQLWELDRVEVDHLTSVWVPAMGSLDASRWPVTLLDIVARLRAPLGCPWDRKQTHESLRSSVIEEAYEVAAAIDNVDPDHLAEELGDLTLLVAMHAQIGDEAGTFSIGDVFDHVNRKLVRRHPHVFGSVTAETPEAVIQTWDSVKAVERANSGSAVEEQDPFDRMPRSMPVLTRLSKISKRRTETAPEFSTDHYANELLRAIDAIVALGSDPEVELERAYRRRNMASSAI